MAIDKTRLVPSKAHNNAVQIDNNSGEGAEQLPTRRSEQKAANRDAILFAATKLFNEIGYEATNIRDIIRRTNLASGTFYNYFKSKEEVFDALQTKALARFKPLLYDINIAARGDLKKFVEMAYQGYFQFCIDNRPFAKHAENSKIYARARFDSPESLVMFAEIKGYILEYVSDKKFNETEQELLTAACIGIAQEVSQIALRDNAIDIRTAAKFATNFVLAAISGIK